MYFVTADKPENLWSMPAKGITRKKVYFTPSTGRHEIYLEFSGSHSEKLFLR